VGPKKQGQFLRADPATGGVIYAVGRWQLVPTNWLDSLHRMSAGTKPDVNLP
jgi:hypothetical protein